MVNTEHNFKEMYSGISHNLVKDALMSTVSHSFSAPNSNSLIEQMQIWKSKNPEKPFLSENSLVIAFDGIGTRNVSEILGANQGDHYLELGCEQLLKTVNKYCDEVAFFRLDGDEFLLIANPSAQKLEINELGEMSTLSQDLEKQIRLDQQAFFNDLSHGQKEETLSLKHRLKSLTKDHKPLDPGCDPHICKATELADISLEKNQRSRQIIAHLFAGTKSPIVESSIPPNLKDILYTPTLQRTYPNNENNEAIDFFARSPLAKLDPSLLAILQEKYGLSDLSKLDAATVSLLESAVYEPIYPRGEVLRMNFFEQFSLELASKKEITIKRASDVLLKDANSASLVNGDQHMQNTVSALKAKFPNCLIFQHHGSFMIVDQDNANNPEAKPYSIINLNQLPEDKSLQKDRLHTKQEYKYPFIVISEAMSRRDGRTAFISLNPANVANFQNKHLLYEFVDIMREQHSLNEVKALGAHKPEDARSEAAKHFIVARQELAAARIKRLRLLFEQIFPTRQLLRSLLPPPPPEVS